MRRSLVVLTVVALAVAGCGGAKSGAPEGGAASGTAAAGGDGRIVLSVTEDGFVPAVVEVPAGEPVTLVVTRTTDKTCATELVMKQMSIDQKLPLNEAVEITFTPTRPETLHYACAMDMIKGMVVVK
jgi:plastocyanin domain-containing protein